MTDAVEIDTVSDPTAVEFWRGAIDGKLMIQRCKACGSTQFYPRPLCLQCMSTAVEWMQASGYGTVYSQTTVHVATIPEREPPYVVAVIELDEGPRLTSDLDGGPCQIGDAVRLSWRMRSGAPPFPVFVPIVDGTTT
jgi:uncharacterized OB-fold protein